MSRPTPEQIAAWPDIKRDAGLLLDNLEAFGYVIVHPDEIARHAPGGGLYGSPQGVFDAGWLTCFDRIFPRAEGVDNEV